MKNKDSMPIEQFDLMEHGKRIMRLGVGMHLFLPRPFKDVRESVFELWQAYLEFVGKDIFTWARLGGGNKSRKVTSSTFKTIEQWLKGEKSYGKTCWISISDGGFDDLGSYSFYLTGYEEPHDEEFDTESCHIEAVIPLDHLDRIGPIATAEAFIKIADAVPFSSGVLGFLFHRSPYKFYKTIGEMRALSARFEGVEISGNERLCYSATEGVPTINWVTLIGNEFLKSLGSIEAVSPKLPSSCVVSNLKHGIAIRTGDRPLLGDKNSTKDELADLRKVYAVIKPLQYVDPEDEFDPDEFDQDQTEQWLKRFDS